SADLRQRREALAHLYEARRAWPDLPLGQLGAFEEQMQAIEASLRIVAEHHATEVPKHLNAASQAIAMLESAGLQTIVLNDHPAVLADLKQDIADRYTTAATRLREIDLYRAFVDEIQDIMRRAEAARMQLQQ